MGMSESLRQNSLTGTFVLRGLYRTFVDVSTLLMLFNTPGFQILWHKDREDGQCMEVQDFSKQLILV